MGASETTWQQVAADALEQVGPPWTDRLVVVRLDTETARVISRSEFADRLERTAPEHKPSMAIVRRLRGLGAHEVPIVLEDKRSAVGMAVASVESWQPTNAKGGAT